jgi:hypothetical protein
MKIPEKYMKKHEKLAEGMKSHARYERGKKERRKHAKK